MNKIVKVVYNSDTLQTEITVDGKPFDTTRINGKEIADWAYPFMIRKVKWNGFYDEMVEKLDGEKEFNLVFDGSENDLNELKEAWEDAPVTIISEDDLENIVVIDYEENTLTTNIIVNNQPFNTSRINGREIEDWIYPFMIRKVKWDGIFEELAKFLDSVEYTIQFSGSNAAMQELMSECPETVSIKKSRTVKSETIQDNKTPQSKETTEIPNKEISLSQVSDTLTNEKEELLKKLCIALSNRCYYMSYVEKQYPDLAAARNNTNIFKINESYGIIKAVVIMLNHPCVSKFFPLTLLPDSFKKQYSAELTELGEKMKKECPRLSADEFYSEGKRLFDCKEYEEAVQWFEKAAESRNGLALKALGECYFYGYGVTKSYKKAYKWYKNALKELPNDSDIMYMMGYFYHHSIGVEVDLDEAVKWYKKAKAAGNKKADTALKEVENKIAEDYYWSARVEENEGNNSEALSLYKKSAELGYISAMYDIGFLYRYGRGVNKNLRKAIDWYKKGSDNGDSFCQFELADCYWNGEGVKLNKSLAFDLFQKSAKQGNADANNRLGLIYDNGDFKKKDISKAIEYYQTAAEKGSKFAMYNLGVTLYDEMNDIDSAKKWLEKSLEAGYEDAQEMLDRIDEEIAESNSTQNYDNITDDEIKEKVGEMLDLDDENIDYSAIVDYICPLAEYGFSTAQLFLGGFYYYGKGIEQNYTRAVIWYKRAAEQGNSDAQQALAECYFYGTGIKQDYVQAAEWYEKAAEQGNSEAQYALYRCYEGGVGVEQSYTKSMEWCKKAAESGNPSAQCEMGLSYEMGDDVEQDYAKAAEWYAKSAEQGDKDSQYYLGELYFYGKGVAMDKKKAKYYMKQASENDCFKATEFLKENF